MPPRFLSKETVVRKLRTYMEDFKAQETESPRAAVYPYMATPFDTTIDKCGRRTRGVRGTIARIFKNQEKDHLILVEEGCGDGTSLRTLVNDVARQHRDRVVTGIGITMSLKPLQVRGDLLSREASPILRQLSAVFKEKALHALQGTENNANLIFLEEDVHLALMKFPFLADLVYSDHTYLHLALPWLAVAATAKILTVGGIAILSLWGDNDAYDSSPVWTMMEVIDYLKKLNPGYQLDFGGKRNLIIRRKGLDSFQTRCGLARYLLNQSKMDMVLDLRQKGNSGKKCIDDWLKSS